jgi:hypothetical protein
VAATSEALSTQPTRTQLLVAQDIPGSDNSSVVPDLDPPNLCTIKGKVVAVSPAKWFCAQPAHRVESCATCSAECLSPEAALENLAAANASEPFVGWNAQGGGADSEAQSVTVHLPGSGDLVRAILWANAGDVEVCVFVCVCVCVCTHCTQPKKKRYLALLV